MNKSVYKGRVFLISVIMMLTAVTFTGSGCRLLKSDKQSVAEKKKAEADKKADAEYEKARKQHFDHQSKEAKAMMKKTKKQAAKANKSRKRKLFSGVKYK